MQTRNYNEERLTRKLVIAMLEANRSMTVEELSAVANIETPDDEIRFRHTLICLRYNTWIEDQGTIWQLTEGGREYAAWCRDYPQRARRLKAEKIRAVAPVAEWKAS